MTHFQHPAKTKISLCFLAASSLSACDGLVNKNTFSSPLNDTGLAVCANETETQLACDNLPAQDATQGRDATLTTNTPVTKIGGGLAAFDWTRLDAQGKVLSTELSLKEQQQQTRCIRDNVTGLTWEAKSGDPADIHFADHEYVWDLGNTMPTDSSASCVGLDKCTMSEYLALQQSQTLCGLSDWRIPSVQELSSISNKSRVLPAIDTDYFVHHSEPRYFTSENRADMPDFAWYVYFSDASVSNTHISDASSIKLVSGTNKVAPITCSKDNASEYLTANTLTIIDKRTGLEWQRCSAEASDPNACVPINEQTPKTWINALTFAQNSSYAGFTDWRLPNLNEFETLISRDCNKPTIISAQYFDNTVTDLPYWTSTPNHFNRDFAWTVDFDQGSHNGFNKTNQHAVRMVRDTKR